MNDATTLNLNSKTRRAGQRIGQLEEMFRRVGFRDLSVSDMARQLRCSKRSLYELAPTKGELILLVLKRRFAQIRQSGWDAAANHAHPAERIWAFLKVGTSALDEMGARLLADIESDPAAALVFTEHQRRRADGIRALIEEGARDGSFVNFHPQLVAEVILVSFRRMRDPVFLQDLGISLSTGWDELTRLILNGLYPRAASSHKATRSTARGSSPRKPPRRSR